MAAAFEISISVPGDSDGLTLMLLGDLYELGTLSPRKMAALCGLALFSRDSGTMDGKQRIKGGRARIRTVLYMAILRAIQCNSVPSSLPK